MRAASSLRAGCSKNAGKALQALGKSPGRLSGHHLVKQRFRLGRRGLLGVDRNAQQATRRHTA